MRAASAMQLLLCCLAVGIAGLHIVAAEPFYLPASEPTGYKYNDPIPMQVNKLTSDKGQLPFSYYSLPFCAPETVEQEDMNLGQILAGDNLESSSYELLTAYNDVCKVLCDPTYTAEEMQKFDEMIREEYVAQWVLDGLPAAVRIPDPEMPGEFLYSRGFPLGAVDPDTGIAYINNHVRFTIMYSNNEDPNNLVRIVGFEVEPFSVKHKFDGATFKLGSTQLRTCNSAQHVTNSMEHQPVNKEGQIIFTYDVVWEESTVSWFNRWDMYLKGTTGDDDVHWFSIINSLLVALLLTGMIAMILVRALNKDIQRYNSTTIEDAAEDTGWKLIHGDVFRPPTGTFGPIMLAAFVGSGIQIAMMAFSVMLFAILGTLSPANSGGLLTALFLLYVFNGSFGGYQAARLYRLFKGQARTRTTFLTAAMYPSMVSAVGFLINLFVWARGSSAAIPFGTMFALLVLWLGVSMPLVFLGAFFGYRKEEEKLPVPVKEVERPVPQQPWYLNTIPATLTGGILPFGAVFIELYFIMTSLWESQTFTLFHFLLLSLIILAVTSAEISIVFCYFQLCSLNHRWWWRAFLTSGTSGLYMFLYAILYFATRLEITDGVAILVYFGYMALISATFFLLTGSIGLLACLAFVRAIYSAIKID